MKLQDFVEIKNLNGYLINDMGVVFSKKSGKELKTNNGTVEVYIDGVKRKKNVAHLVLETFVGNPYNAKRVRFKNGDKSDASLANVEWVIPKTRKSGTTKDSSNSTSSRKKEIAKRKKQLEREMKTLEKEEFAINKKDSITALVKNNLTSIVEGIVKGENISVLTKRMLGKKLSRVELSKNIEKHCGVSLNDIEYIAKLCKTKPNYVEAIVRLQKNSKLKGVVFNNVAWSINNLNFDNYGNENN